MNYRRVTAPIILTANSRYFVILRSAGMLEVFMTDAAIIRASDALESRRAIMIKL